MRRTAGRGKQMIYGGRRRSEGFPQKAEKKLINARNTLTVADPMDDLGKGSSSEKR